MGLSPDGDKEDLWSILGWGLKIQMPSLFNGPDTISFPHEESPVLADQDFTDMSLADITPAGFLMKGTEKFFQSEEAVLVRDEPEFIGSVGQDVNQKAA